MADAGVSLIPPKTLTSKFTPPNLPKLVPRFHGSTSKLQKHSSRLTYKRIKSIRLSVDRRRPPSSSFRTFATPTIRANGGLIRSANPMVLNMATISPAKFHEEEEKITTTTKTTINSPDLSASNGDEDEVSNDNFVNTVNAVLADFVDGQNYLKETGRTTPRPMKRRALIVCLALSGLRKHADDILMSQNNFQRTRSNLRSNSPSSFATTWKLASQVSFGASKHTSDQTDTVI